MLRGRLRRSRWGAGRRRWDTARAPHRATACDASLRQLREGGLVRQSVLRPLHSERKDGRSRSSSTPRFYSSCTQPTVLHSINSTFVADRTVQGSHSVHCSYSQPMVRAEVASAGVDTELSEKTHSTVSKKVDACGRAANEKPPCCVCHPRDQQQLV